MWRRGYSGVGDGPERRRILPRWLLFPHRLLFPRWVLLTLLSSIPLSRVRGWEEEEVAVRVYIHV
jgi:hypothetical protein